MEPRWLQWAKRLQAISQTGLHYGKDPYDVERFEEVKRIAAEMTAEGANETFEKILSAFSEQMGYATPKVDVRGVVFQDDKILLVKERVDGGWTLPGGWADIGETPSECVEKEVFEESGFTVRAKKLAAVYDRARHPHKPPLPFDIYKMFFLCEIVEGEAKTSYETLDVRFFGENEIPPLSVSRTLPEQIQFMFEFYRNPSMECYFD